MQIAQQAEQLRATLEVQANRVTGWISSLGLMPGRSDLQGIAQQALGSVGKLTSAVGSVLGAGASLFMVLVIGLLCVGIWMVGLPPSLQKLKVYSWHKWAGITVLMLTVLRLIWRHVRKPPPLPAAITPLDRRLAPWGHATLYVLLFAMPITGWLSAPEAGSFGLVVAMRAGRPATSYCPTRLPLQYRWGWRA